MKIAESELIINSDGSVFHLHLKPEEIADNIILVGDIGRVPLVAKYLTDIEFQRSCREFISTTGRYNGKRVTVISTGIGTDNCDIVMNEIDALANIDFKTREVVKNPKSLNILRIGTCGALQPDIPLGGFIFSHISIGCDGLMNWYSGRERIDIEGIGGEFVRHMKWNPCLCKPYFVKSGEDMIRRFEDCTIKGMTITAQGFYGPQGRALRMGLSMPDMIEDLESFRWNGWRVTNFEMESSAITGIGRMLGHNCGTICCAVAQRYNLDAKTDYASKMDEMIRLSLDRLTL